MSAQVKVYLDNSATTRPQDSVMDAMREAMAERYFNPSALYGPALDAEKLLTGCRRDIMQALRAAGGRVIFASGGTEADNLAIIGAMKRARPGRVLYSAGEHPAVAESCKALTEMGHEALEIPLREDGLIDLSALEALLTDDTRLVCLMQINNETGAVQPLAEAAALRNRLCPEALFHVDGVQGFLRQGCAVSQLGIDSYALSGHKIHGPKGIGALWVGDRVQLQPLARGGGQEDGLRSGTENTPGIAGLAAAIAAYPRQNDMRRMKLRLYERLRGSIPEMRVNGPDPASPSAADHILNLSFPPVRAETMLHALEGMGVLVGNGSACSSRKKKLSHVLSAMRLPAADIESAVRFSLNPFLREEDMDCAAGCVIRSYDALKRFTRR